jgi:NADH:ubiquinone oxidoreductase subunit E
MGTSIAEMRNAHETLASFAYPPISIRKGYTMTTLRIDLSSGSVETQPVTEQMVELWTGGRGFDLWLTLKEISGDTKWDDPANPLCFSAGPLGGTVNFPGAGKTLVTGISPLTHSIMNSNVGGYFGPYLKGAGFDALTVVGKAAEDVLIVIDAEDRQVTIEKAPLEDLDSHLLAEQLTEMYARDEDDRRNVTVVSSGRGADHTRMGVLNVSFYDWRRKVPRFKQAGRGGMGTVFRDKKVKAIVMRGKPMVPHWTINESKAAASFESCKGGKSDLTRVRAIVERWRADPEYVIEMLQDVQQEERYISQDAVKEIARRTGVSKGHLYHIATFYKAFSLKPRGKTLIQVCVGTACHVAGAPRVMDAFERALDVKVGGTTADLRYSLEGVACLGCCSLAPVVKVGERIHGGVTAAGVPRLMRQHAKEMGAEVDAEEVTRA